MIDPSSFAMTFVEGFSSSKENKKGQKVGISSANEGEGFLFAADHGTHKLDAVNIKTGMIAVSAPLAGDSDFVRYIDSNHEVWVTEMDEAKRQIEVFTFTAGDKPVLSHALDIPVADGPESLTIDHFRKRAYTNLGKQAAAINVKTHAVIAEWPNGCEKPRGTAVDEQRGFLFVGCGEGKAVVLDLNQNGKEVGRLATGAGADLIDYNSGLSHLYITGSKSATLSVLGVSPKGELSLLGTGQAAERSHCVAGDDRNNIWVCDPKHGQLLWYKDTFSAVK
jgi:DNA-binding beta-propeller fold protein YncE